MPDPRDKITPHAIINQAAAVRTALLAIEPGVYTGTTTIEPGVVVTVWEGVEVTLDDEIVMEESGSEYGELIARGTLHIEDNTTISGGMIRATQEGIVVRSLQFKTEKYL